MPNFEVSSIIVTSFIQGAGGGGGVKDRKNYWEKSMGKKKEVWVKNRCTNDNW